MDLTDVELKTLVQTMLGEAANQGPEGLAAVAHVAKNRMQSGKYPSDLVSVLKQPKQFSAWNAGSGGNNPGRFGPNSPGWAEAEQIAKGVFGGTIADNTGGSLMYHATSITPYWASAETGDAGTFDINDHRFYPREPIDTTALAAIGQATGELPQIPRRRPSDSDRMLNDTFASLPKLSASDSLAMDPVTARPSGVFDTGYMPNDMRPFNFGEGIKTAGMTAGTAPIAMDLPQFPVPATASESLRTMDPIGYAVQFGDLSGLPGVPKPMDQPPGMQAFRDQNSPFPRQRSDSPNAMADVMGTFDRFGPNGTGQQINALPQRFAANEYDPLSSILPPSNAVPDRLTAGEPGVVANQTSVIPYNGMPMPFGVGDSARTRAGYPPSTVGMGGVDIDPTQLVPVPQRYEMGQLARDTAAPKRRAGEMLETSKGVAEYLGPVPQTQQSGFGGLLGQLMSFGGAPSTAGLPQVPAPSGSGSSGGSVLDYLASMFADAPGSASRPRGYSPGLQYAAAGGGAFTPGGVAHTAMTNAGGLPPGFSLGTNGYVYAGGPGNYEQVGRVTRSNPSGYSDEYRRQLLGQ